MRTRNHNHPRRRTSTGRCTRGNLARALRRHTRGTPTTFRHQAHPRPDRQALTGTTLHLQVPPFTSEINGPRPFSTIPLRKVPEREALNHHRYIPLQTCKPSPCNLAICQEPRTSSLTCKVPERASFEPPTAMVYPRQSPGTGLAMLGAEPRGAGQGARQRRPTPETSVTTTTHCKAAEAATHRAQESIS